MTVAERLAEVNERIATAAKRAGRDPERVRLVAVTKGFAADAAIEAYRAGAHDLGENRAQELREKALAVTLPVEWHFIGHLQTNKARHVVGTARLIHSVDRLGLAEAIARRARSLGVEQEVLIEVNVSGEASKHGAEPARALSLAEEVDALGGIKVRGLMTMAPLADRAEASRPVFSELRDLGERLRQAFPDAVELSMGMSRDFEVAIEEGATLVRVGEAIFGPRRRRLG
ncbi:MAG: YggS family pyridoxal phosphate-dependent enzyme [Actinomycetota bacterium]